MARLPQFQEQFVSTRVSDPNAGATGQQIAQAGGLLMQAGDIVQRRKLANDMTKVSELSTDFELSLQDDFETFKQPAPHAEIPAARDTEPVDLSDGM